VGQGDSGGQHQAGVSPIRSQAALRVIENGIADLSDVNAKEVRIMGSKSELLRTLVAASSAKTVGFGVPVLYRSGAHEEIRTPAPQIRSVVVNRA
jgi:hypothetical protein